MGKNECYIMGLYRLFSCNVEIQYKSYLLSKAMLFTVITSILNIVLPFIIAHRSKGFWLRTDSFYEQPALRFTYEYLLIVETDDPSHSIICGEAAAISSEIISEEENCAQIQVQEYDYNEDGKNDALEIRFLLILPKDRTATSIILILALDLKLKTVCPLNMQSLAVVDKTFATASSGFKFVGDIELYQVAHIPCITNLIDTKYNNSLLNHVKTTNSDNLVDYILKSYFQRQVTTQVKPLHSRIQNGHTGTMDLNFYLRIPEMQIKYLPSLLQELKWAWPQYLSLVVIFYWFFSKVKKFVFHHRLLMAWEVMPSKKHS